MAKERERERERERTTFKYLGKSSGVGGGTGL
jgi:hypothetical protein